MNRGHAVARARQSTNRSLVNGDFPKTICRLAPVFLPAAWCNRSRNMPKAPSRFHAGNCGADVHPSPTIGRNIPPNRDAPRREADRKNMFPPQWASPFESRRAICISCKYSSPAIDPRPSVPWAIASVRARLHPGLIRALTK